MFILKNDLVTMVPKSPASYDQNLLEIGPGVSLPTLNENIQEFMIHIPFNIMCPPKNLTEVTLKEKVTKILNWAILT